jgi:hypothetical protein
LAAEEERRRRMRKVQEAELEGTAEAESKRRQARLSHVLTMERVAEKALERSSTLSEQHAERVEQEVRLNLTTNSSIPIRSPFDLRSSKSRIPVST